MSGEPEHPEAREDALLPLSALSHLVFCERRAALIHLEGVWSENEHTVEGAQLHAAVDENARRMETRREVRILRGVHIRSFALGVSGIADVVELHANQGGVALPGAPGRWRPFPVEYKRGKPKPDDSDVVQLCAQGMALEEMLGTAIPTGAMFYGKTRRRLDVQFDGSLRERTAAAAARLRALVASGRTPQPVHEPKCAGCSLLDVCKPEVTGRGIVAEYLGRWALRG